jgi:hypothetical protein
VARHRLCKEGRWTTDPTRASDKIAGRFPGRFEWGTSLIRTNSILKRLALGASFPLIVFVIQASAAVTTACGDSSDCKVVRDSTYQALLTWEQCDPTQPNQCIVVQGNPKDCTGVLTCNFAVNPNYRTQAEQTVLVMGEQSRGCNLCATPSCGNGETAYCEPASRRCMVQSTSSAVGGPPASDGGSAIVLDAGGD